MPDRADQKWERMVRRHAEFAGAAGGRTGPPEHRPEVAILACSDARVPPTLLFGQDAGNAFVVRLAGNSATPGAVASLTYAVEALGVDLIVVLGHTGCGAVTAAVRGVAEPGLNPILTPIDEMLAACDACGDVEAAVAANVRHNVRRLRRDRGPLGAAVTGGRVMVIGAVHDLTTGRLIELDTPVGASTSPSASVADLPRTATTPTSRTPTPTTSTPTTSTTSTPTTSTTATPTTATSTPSTSTIRSTNRPSPLIRSTT